MSDSTEITADSPKRPYQTPELRDLGSVAEVTQGGSGAPTIDSPNYLS